MLEEFKDHCHRWEVIKMLIRTETIKISIARQKARNEKLLYIEAQLKQLSQYQAHSLSQAQLDLRQALIDQRNQIVEKKVEGAILRSKVDWAYMGCKPTKYFFNLEKTKYARKTITRLNDCKGQAHSTTVELQNLLVQYYSNLYQSHDNEVSDEALEQFFEGLQGPKITQAQANDLEILPTPEELQKALLDMENNKTPGPDGFPAEFYKFFWEKLRIPFVAMLKQGFQSGFDVNFLRCILTLLGKKDRDPLWIDNWRPISLLNSDYKIIAKALANKISKVLPDIIDQDQKGFVKGRFIGENILELITLIEYCDQNQIPALLLSCDFYKAFDSVSHKFFQRALLHLGFGPNFRDFMLKLYANMEASVLNNGHLTPRFRIFQGFRQGDPLSSINYIITQQILILKLKQNQALQGITVNNHQMLSGYFADDMWAVLYGSQQNLQNFLKQLSLFEISGLKLSYDKTQIMRIGSLRNSNARFYTIKPLQWIDPHSHTSIKVLGIKLGNNQALISNFDNLLDQLTHIINVWNKRSVNPMGKVLLINSLMSSITVYKVLMLPLPPSHFIAQFKAKIVNFLWNDKVSRIRYSKVILPKCDGGLGMVDLSTKNTALKASWVSRIIKKDGTPFAALMYQMLPIKHPWIWECNIKSNTIMEMFGNSLWIQIWSAWAQYKYEIPYCRDAVLLQVLWYNQQILRYNKPWLSKNLMQAGIVRFQDIYDELTDTILTYQQICVRFNNNNIDVLQYNSLLAAIPRQWKDLLQAYTPLERNVLDMIYKKPKMTSYLYSLSKLHFKDNDGCRLAWQRDLAVEIDMDTWNQVIALVYKNSNHVEFRYFQYRIIHRLLVTNRLRNKWDATVSPHCPYCNSIETPLHLLFECDTIQKIWKFTQHWLRKLLQDTDIIISPEIVILNNYHGSNKAFINAVLLYVKQYIYSSKCLGTPPLVSHIIKNILQAQKIEKLVAIRSQQLNKHQKKWRVFLDWIFPNEST